MKRSILALSLALLGTISSAAHADFYLTASTSSYNADSKDLTFSISFNRAPEFGIFDSFNREATGFQFFILSDIEKPQTEIISIIPGSEANWTTYTIPVRNATVTDPSDTGPGGWGSIISTISFDWDAASNTFSFTTHYSNLHETPFFRYMVITTEYGGGNSQAYIQISAVPEPSSYAMLGLGLGLIGFAARRRYG